MELFVAWMIATISTTWGAIAFICVVTLVLVGVFVLALSSPLILLGLLVLWERWKVRKQHATEDRIQPQDD